MKQEDKELLLRDLCARLPYGVRFDCEQPEKVNFIDIQDDEIWINGSEIKEVKPYLFHLSSMTEEQKREYIELLQIGPATGIDWLNKNHFDYRNLIDKNLAIDCTNLNIY